MADDGFQGFHLTALDARRFDLGNALRGDACARADRLLLDVRAEPSVVQEIRELPPRPAAPTPSWLDVVENNA